MTTTTPPAVAHYHWAVTFQHSGDDPVTITGTMTSIASREEAERSVRLAAERSFRHDHPAQDGPVSVLSVSLEQE